MYNFIESTEYTQRIMTASRHGMLLYHRLKRHIYKSLALQISESSLEKGFKR